MPDTPVAPPERDPYYNPLEQRVSRMEEDVRDLKALAADFDARARRIEDSLVEIKTLFAATLPHLATKADLADMKVALAEKPSRTYMWGILAVLLTAYACGLAALAILK